MVALAGTHETARVVDTPFAVLSGTATLIAPDAVVQLPGTGGAADAVLSSVPLMPATPPHTGPAGVITTTGKGLTVNVAQFEILAVPIAAQVPPNTTRYA